MTATRAVLFDLDGTLLPLDFDQFLPEYLGRMGRWFYDLAGLDIVTPSMRAVGRMLENDGRRSNADVFWSAAAPQIGETRPTLERMYADFVAVEGEKLGAGIVANPAARIAVEECRRRGLRVALATNPVFPRCMIAERARWGGLDLGRFDLVTCSERMGFCKPRVEYYQAVADALEVDPRACLMVGNDVTLDLEPARRLGMRTCLVTGEFVLRGEADFTPDCTATLAELPSLLGSV